jgi:diacylglycerol kinase (ATP)
LTIHITCIINSRRKLPVAIGGLLSRIAATENTELEIFRTRHPKHATELAAAACEAGKDVLIAIGGDGTFNEIVHGIMHTGNRDILLALIPNGTGNDFLLGEDLVFTPEKFFQALYSNQSYRIDIGEVRQPHATSYFINIADVGFGGYVIRTLEKQRYWAIGGKFSYSLAILRAFFGFRKPRVRIVMDEEIYTGSLLLLAVCNSTTFGHGLVVNPLARSNDGRFNVSIFGKVSVLDYLWYLPKLKKGMPINHPEVSYVSCASVSVSILSGKAPIEIDGETCGQGDVSFEIVPSRIRLLKY